jgi:hypothetical protein
MISLKENYVINENGKRIGILLDVKVRRLGTLAQHCEFYLLSCRGWEPRLRTS